MEKKKVLYNLLIFVCFFFSIKAAYTLSSDNIKAFIIPGEAVDYYQDLVEISAEGKHIYIHPTFGKMNRFTAWLETNSSKNIIERGELHLMKSVMKAISKSGYLDPPRLKRIEQPKRQQDADNTINREGVPEYIIQ